tara:strand:- start:34 stop:570 length:537 start_codon:yes stop_codon:yes gene_type:complete
MNPWFSHFRSAQRKESKFDSRWVQLATIGIDDTPRVRTVVFRGWSEFYEMQIYTDKRSQKYHELDLNNNVEICWLFPRSKCQFRFRGTSRIDLGIESHRHWEQLNEKSKSMWFWPSPGDHFSFDKKDYLSNKTRDKADNFIFLKIDITHVDQLLLHNPIHIRRRWIRKDKWVEERINP